MHLRSAVVYHVCVCLHDHGSFVYEVVQYSIYKNNSLYSVEIRRSAGTYYTVHKSVERGHTFKAVL